MIASRVLSKGLRFQPKLVSRVTQFGSQPARRFQSSFKISPIGLVPSRNYSGKVRIYTKTGDKGTSSLFNGERRSKTDPIFEALGTTDELNAQIGVAREYCQELDNSLNEALIHIQRLLIDAGGYLATPPTSSEAKIKRTEFSPGHVEWLEQQIDQMELELPPLRQFVLPGGGHAAAALHVARSVARRAERRVAQVTEPGEPVARFFNRLSDYFFVASRLAALKAQREEIPYKKPVA